ncbi:hypothetical protein J2R78_008698 [Bradyrhizobium sp. USDA 4538]|uniref:DDE-type integrase/transposase/recombinase n=1 Tax=unclassified Bradyrhizobium TaxID=2631580 RepID=UPI00209EF86E|nr:MULTISPECIES: DDE-type integrase/transposase/recombinase [unclassified Bradyrhizobium]MCP1845664.1 hypothetical protein [Bradyrhizobium sp. USDA 4538]MCP1907012.1 hypothetical protein [Bradyrhizobium sp. USDA 4537]MCP1985488.1 hypothetical protein [Bradyrhizobium sp. USDA 4539]
MKPFKSPERLKRLDGLEGWPRERFIRHRGNADVVRQDLLAEKGVTVSRRTLQRAMQPYRRALKAEALATMRFETPPGRQLQIDFGERLVEIGGVKIKAFVFVATLGHSRRVHVGAFRAEKQEHWFAGLESTFTTFSGVPEEVLMDNPRALVVRRRRWQPVGSVQRQADCLLEALGLPASPPAHHIGHARKARPRMASVRRRDACSTPIIAAASEGTLTRRVTPLCSRTDASSYTSLTAACGTITSDRPHASGTNISKIESIEIPERNRGTPDHSDASKMARSGSTGNCRG